MVRWRGSRPPIRRWQGSKKSSPLQPKEVRIPLRMHIGAPSRPVVEQGATVRRGDLIAAIPEGELGANIHASMGGVVAEVGANVIRIQRSS